MVWNTAVLPLVVCPNTAKSARRSPHCSSGLRSFTHVSHAIRERRYPQCSSSRARHTSQIGNGHGTFFDHIYYDWIVQLFNYHFFEKKKYLFYYWKSWQPWMRTTFSSSGHMVAPGGHLLTNIADAAVVAGVTQKPLRHQWIHDIIIFFVIIHSTVWLTTSRLYYIILFSYLICEVFSNNINSIRKLNDFIKENFLSLFYCTATL